MHVRVIQENQKRMMQVLQRVELGMCHPQATPPATTNFLPMAPNMLPVAHNISLPLATNSSLSNVPNTSQPMPSNTSPSVVPNTSLCMLPTTPVPVTPATALPLLGTRESPAESCSILDSSMTPNHPEPYGLNHTYINNSLPSDKIVKESLKSVEDALRGYDELKCAEKASTLTQKLAREAFFGEDVMKRCTPGGTKDFPALPKDEMFSLKKEVFQQLPQFWQCPANFEKLWKTKCWPSVEQACCRLRRKRQYTCN